MLNYLTLSFQSWEYRAPQKFIIIIIIIITFILIQEKGFAESLLN